MGDRARGWQSQGPKMIGWAMIIIAGCVVIRSREFSLKAVAVRSIFQDFAHKPAKYQDQSQTKDPATSLLVDAIVSLVQSYYVETDRVSNQLLISGAMRSLAYAVPDLSFEESDSHFELSARAEMISFSKTTDISYEELIGQMKALSSFCERANIPRFTTGSSASMLGGERSCSTIVLNAMLSSLDAHSSLMSAESYQELRQGTDGSFGGLGVLVGVKDNILTVLKPMPRSPALRSGVKKHDHILSIDGFSTFGLSLDQLVGHMRGEPGSAVQLDILRDHSAAPFSVSVQREIIEVDSVEMHEHHKGNVHFPQLVVDSFSSRTAKEVMDALRSFRRRYPLHGLVLDFRSNPGGLLDQAVQVSDLFLREGVIVSTKGRRDEVERAGRGYDEVDFPVVVLMNEDSASASEIVAGALQDNGRAVVVGQPSFGKGSVQTLFELPQDRALKLTISRYFTPSNRSIQNIGITPDVWLQPVYKATENVNLFGNYRYRSEAFLPNHLSAVSTLNDTPSSSLKGYYLTDVPSTGESDDVKSDPELSVASSIISKSVSVYGDKLPEGARRASHWLAIATPNLKKDIDAMSAATQNWLLQNQHIDWQVNGRRTKAPLALQIRDSEEIIGRPGGRVPVRWRVTNISNETVENVSMFVQSPVAGIETQEILIGTVKGSETREGEFNMLLPQSIQVGKHHVNAGLATDATALPGSTGEFAINIEERKFADLAFGYEFVDGPTSHEAGVLEENEQGVIKMRVQNRGDMMAKDVLVRGQNLAGSQIVLGQEKWSIGTIQPGDSFEVLMPVSGTNRIESRKILFGVVISSRDIGASLAKEIEVKAMGKVTAQREVRTLSH